MQQFAFQSPSTWVAPAGVTSVIAECWGGGGSAGAAASGTTVGDGGGGGAYSQKTIAVTAGTSYTIIVGAGGASVSGASAGNPGQDTSFVNSATLLAKAGAGGQGGGVGGGAGGNKASGVGTITTSGGAGAIGSANNGGGGGSSGGSGGDGISPSAAGTTGGNPGPTNNTYSNGAYGGNSSTGGNGSPGKPAGGGGGGPTGGSTSGAGGAGMVQLTYTVTNPPTTNTNLFLENAVQYANDSVDDGDYFITYGSEYVIRELKRTFTNNTNIPNCSIKIRSTEASITSPILLQVYNVNSATWETIASQTLKPADTDFVLQGAPTGTVANYYDSTNTVSFRVYQQVV